jgi:hypothetical protein
MCNEESDDVFKDFMDEFEGKYGIQVYDITFEMREFMKESGFYTDMYQGMHLYETIYDTVINYSINAAELHREVQAFNASIEQERKEEQDEEDEEMENYI